jgi:hypothetical protein
MADTADTRRSILRAIVERDGLSVAAKRFGKPDRQINDMIAGRKAFGEKVARAMEKNYAPERDPGWLDQPVASSSEVGEPTSLILSPPPGSIVRTRPSAKRGRDPMYLQTLPPHEARLLADSEAVENKRKPQLFEGQIHSVTLYAYPLVTFDELREGVVVDRENQEFMRGRETDICDREPGRHDFAVRVRDDSMNGGARPIPTGTVVFIEATDEAAAGEIVLIQIGTGTPILRTLVDVGDGYQLLPSAPGLQASQLPDGFRPLGVAFSWNVKAPSTSADRKKLSKAG